MNKFAIFFLCLVLGNNFKCNGRNNLEEPILYLFVDKLPKFDYKNMTAIDYIYYNLNWPDNFDGQGTVVVSFVVKKNGKISDIQIMKKLHPECDNEVRRVVGTMPKWKPGKKGRKKVGTILYLPVKFKVIY